MGKKNKDKGGMALAVVKVTEAPPPPWQDGVVFPSPPIWPPTQRFLKPSIMARIGMPAYYTKTELMTWGVVYCYGRDVPPASMLALRSLFNSMYHECHLVNDMVAMLNGVLMLAPTHERDVIEFVAPMDYIASMMGIEIDQEAMPRVTGRLPVIVVER